MFEKCGGDPSTAGHHTLRAWLVDGVTADLRFASRRPAQFSVMDWFARRGFDCWCVDMEGYGRSTKERDDNAPIAQGADDCFALRPTFGGSAASGHCSFMAFRQARCARLIRATASAARRPARARRHGVD